MDDSQEWFQQELCERRQREDELMKRLRKACGSFRAECDEFHAEYFDWLREIAASDAYEQEKRNGDSGI